MSGLPKIAGSIPKVAKLVYCSGGKKPTLLDAFVRYSSKPHFVDKLSEAVSSSATELQPDGQKVLEGICKGYGEFTTRVKSLGKIKKKIPKVFEDLSQKDAVKLISSGNMENVIGDGLGGRIILDNHKSSKDLLNKLIKAHKQGTITFESVENYHGDGIKPYFSKKDLKKLRELRYIDTNGEDWGVITCDKVKAAGFTRTNFNLLINGKKVEFQVGGPHTIRFGEVEHYLYDMRRVGQADLSKLSEDQKALFYKMRKDYMKVFRNQSKNDAYNEYLTKIWKVLKDAENSPRFPALPELPQGIPKVLAAENLLLLEKGAL